VLVGGSLQWVRLQWVRVFSGCCLQWVRVIFSGASLQWAPVFSGQWESVLSFRGREQLRGWCINWLWNSKLGCKRFRIENILCSFERSWVVVIFSSLAHRSRTWRTIQGILHLPASNAKYFAFDSPRLKSFAFDRPSIRPWRQRPAVQWGVVHEPDRRWPMKCKDASVFSDSLTQGEMRQLKIDSLDQRSARLSNCTGQLMHHPYICLDWIFVCETFSVTASFQRASSFDLSLSPLWFSPVVICCPKSFVGQFAPSDWPVYASVLASFVKRRLKENCSLALNEDCPLKTRTH
jgi:hypothetical protein